MGVEVKLPQLGEGVTAGEVVGISVKVGDTVKAEQVLLELETNKATVELPSPEAGVVESVHVKVGDTVPVGGLIVTLKSQSSQEAAPSAASQGKSESAPASASRAALASAAPVAAVSAASNAPAEMYQDLKLPVPAGPMTRKRARELGINLYRVPGTGVGGRITLSDLENFLRGGSGALTPALPPLPDFSKWGEVEALPYKSLRKKTGEHMALCWQQIPHVTQMDLVDVTELEVKRKEMAPKIQAQGGKLTPNVLLLKAVAAALTKFPQFRSSLDLAKGEILQKNYCHIGIAASTPKGLMVPVIRDVDQKDLATLAKELSDLGQRAMEGKIKIEELQGGVFTISNLGHIGGTAFTPIVNYPEVAILGVSRHAEQAVVRDGKIVSRLMLPLSLSYDHRVIDGVDGIAFTRFIAEYLESGQVF